MAVTNTATANYQSTKLFTTTVTEFVEPSQASGFSCHPLTITNSEGATLKLESNCALSYGPPPSSTSAASTAAAAVARDAKLWERQTASQCSSYLTTYEFVTVSASVITTSTVTLTITVTQSNAKFSCPTLAVTNSVGDVLSLDASCGLAFVPASSTSSGGTGSTNSASTAAATSSKSSGTSTIHYSWPVVRWISVVVVVAFLL